MQHMHPRGRHLKKAVSASAGHGQAVEPGKRFPAQPVGCGGGGDDVKSRLPAETGPGGMGHGGEAAAFGIEFISRNIVLERGQQWEVGFTWRRVD